VLGAQHRGDPLAFRAYRAGVGALGREPAEERVLLPSDSS